MSGRLYVRGGNTLGGSIHIKGGKNAILPLLAATILSEGEVVLHNCPHLVDVENMLAILEDLGCGIRFEGDSIIVDSSSADSYVMPEHLARELRSSIFMLGPIIGRYGQAQFTYPGGCEIGLRPINMHLSGLRALRANIEEIHGYIYCKPSKLQGADIHLDYPSVGATENIIMAAVKAHGKTKLHNAAKEPEIEDLQRFLNSMGAKVRGAGTGTIEIEGVEKLHGTQYWIMPDRIVAGTFMAAAATNGSDIELCGVCPDHLRAAMAKLLEAGCTISSRKDKIRVKAPKRLRAFKRLETMPYPGFPTDLQAQFFTLACVSEGTTIVVENVFESRYRHAAELIRMGANVTVYDRMAIIQGVDRMTGAEVFASDLRGGAAMVLAGLLAEGETVVNGTQYIDRGYESIESDLAMLGADISRR